MKISNLYNFFQENFNMYERPVYKIIDVENKKSHLLHSMYFEKENGYLYFYDDENILLLANSTLNELCIDQILDVIINKNICEIHLKNNEIIIENIV